MTPARLPEDAGPRPAIALNAKDAAHAIGMSERWLWNSDIPRVRLGRRVVFLVSDLEAYAAQRRTHGEAA